MHCLEQSFNEGLAQFLPRGHKEQKKIRLTSKYFLKVELMWSPKQCQKSLVMLTNVYNKNLDQVAAAQIGLNGFIRFRSSKKILFDLDCFAGLDFQLEYSESKLIP